MPRPPDSERIDLKQMFGQVQAKMLADLDVNRVFEHGTSQGNATEETWRRLLETYLPKRFKIAPAFVVNPAGKRSKQIDLAIYDDLESPPIFAHSAGIHLPIESVYAVFEVKSQMTKTWLRDAGMKAASVRTLQKRGQKRTILAGLLTANVQWVGPQPLKYLERGLKALTREHQVDFGCAVENLSFEYNGTLQTSKPDQILMFFMLRLIHRLNQLGPAPPADLKSYVRSMGLFKTGS